MRILWAPWRSDYVESVGKIEDCFLCGAASQPENRWREFLVLYKSSESFIILNKYPYNSGHLMIVPLIHTSSYESLSDATVMDMHRLLKLSLRILGRVFNPHGFNIGYNLGRPAGAGLETHLHMHVVPRWNGDTNFMPVLAKTKVISQDLLTTYDRLKEALRSELP
ncbi:MAG TPA: HIT domain-containing protein [Aquificaceae bacterium]|nr:HIT domain-containing protein [Aquificaceae bacterium]HIQ30624.1 HIT domain-containing protein [Aquifex aeolicus]